MSYQVLARKWRPHNFSQVVGQQHVLTALSNGLAQNKVHHAYLFSGTRGVGKTTIARILAKSLNCEIGVTSTPCGKCENCVAIDQGRFVDLLEIDAASRTKVDDTREMLDNVQYKPAVGRYKVYLIDEVHMLSKHSFNALLKTLEEPPEYVKFLLATTDPQKLPITVLSRCLQFHLKAILPEQIETQLAFILQQEKATFEHAALSVIAKAADGSMRDALSLTDQALAFGAGNIEYQSVLKMLGTLDNNHLEYLLHFIASGNVEKVFQKIEEFVSLGADFAKLHQELAALCHQIALQQLQPAHASGEKSTIKLLSERLNPEEVQLYYQIALQGYRDFSFAPNGKVALEMTVMRLLAFKPANYIEVDEKQLISASSPQVTENTQSPLENKPQVVETEAIHTSIIPPQDASFSTPLPHNSMEMNEQHKPAQELQNVRSEPLQVKPVTPAAKPIQATVSISNEPSNTEGNASIPIKQQTVQTPVIDNKLLTKEKTESVSEITNSRNMLRSHRLKRSETKKSLATTDIQINEPVVAAPVVHIEQKPLTSAPSFAPDIPVAPAEEVANSHLVPIEQYQESEFDANNYDTNNYQESFEQPDYEHYIPDAQPKAVIAQEESAQQLAPTSKQSFADHNRLGQHPYFSDQPFEAVEIDTAKYVEDKLTDPWCLAIQKMNLLGLVKLLAKNSVMKKVDNQIVLTLKAEHQHLLNNSSLCEELQKQLKSFYGEQFSMYIEVGDVKDELTAFESEMVLYEQYLENAKRAIVEDENIIKLAANCGAKVYENSVIPL